MNKADARKFLEILLEFEQNPSLTSVKGLTQEEVVDIVYIYFPDITGLSPRLDFDERLIAAKAKLNEILASVEEPTPTVPLPEQLKELEKNLEILEQEAQKQDPQSLSNQRTQTRVWIDFLKRTRFESITPPLPLETKPSEKGVEKPQQVKHLYLKPVKEVAPIILEDKEVYDLQELLVSASNFSKNYKEKEEEDKGKAKTWDLLLVEKFKENSSTRKLLPDISNDSFQKVAHMVALDFIDRLRKLNDATKGNYELLRQIKPAINSVWLFNALSDPRNEKLVDLIPNETQRKEVFEAAQSLAVSAESYDRLIRGFLYPSRNSKFVDILYGQEEPIEFEITDSPSPESYLIEPALLTQTYQEQERLRREREGQSSRTSQFIDFDYRKILDSYSWYKRARGFIPRIIRFFAPSVEVSLTTVRAYVGYKFAPSIVSYLTSFWRVNQVPLLAASAGTYVEAGGAASTALVPLTTTPYAVLDASGAVVSQGLATVILPGEAGAIATGVGAEAVATGAVAGEVAATTTGVAAGAAAGAGAGSIVPVIGTAIGAVVGLVSSFFIKRAWPWLKDKIKRFPEVIAAIGVGFIGGGFLLGSIPLIITGGAFTGVAASSGGFGAVQAGLENLAHGLYAGFTNLVLPSIAVPTLITLIGLPILIALIIFIINSGAYVVPPGTSEFSGIIESPYIGVEKTASPDCLNRSGCPGLPGRIRYDIRIFAKRGALSNVTVDNTYQVLGDGSITSLPQVPDIDVDPTIDPGSDFTFSYELTFNQELDNSIVLDTLKVTADTSEQTGAVASDIATVIIGNPPASSCPILGGDVRTGSYNGVAETGHGSNDYWNSSDTSSFNDCGFDIPAFSGCAGPTSISDPDSNNICRNEAPLCNHYGYAADVPSSAETPVFLPSIFGETLDWQFVDSVSINGGRWGYGYTFRSGDYQLYLGHLNLTTPPSSAPSGTVIGTLYPLGGPHVHIELQINGQWVKPDFLCGGVGP